MVKRILTLLALFALLVTACTSVQPAAPAAEQKPTTETKAAPASNGQAYVDSLTKRKDETYDTAKFKKEGPYRIALAAQGPTNSWAALFDEHARAHVDELGKTVVSELLYADANGSADKQVPQMEDLLSQDPDAIILVPMALS